jgi:hypothetical protein
MVALMAGGVAKLLINLVVLAVVTFDAVSPCNFVTPEPGALCDAGR